MTVHPYVRLCEEAECSLNSPSIHHPRDKAAQAEWLRARLERHGVIMTAAEVAETADAFWRMLDAKPGSSRTIRLRL